MAETAEDASYFPTRARRPFDDIMSGERVLLVPEVAPVLRTPQNPF
jgi:hypothetical protein